MSFSVPLAGQSINTAQIGIDTTITSGNISCTNISAVNGTINNLTTTIFNPASITTTTLDTVNLNVTNSIPLLNVQTLNVSTKNVCQLNVLNISASNISATNISATSFTSPDVQPLLIAGDNVSILNNIINVTNDALLPSNANFSSINTSSLTVNNDVIIGGTSYLTDLIVSDMINCSTIQANNLSTAEMQFGNSLAYVAVAKILEVNTTDTISSGNTLPVTSGAVYNAINTQTTTISTMWSYMLSEPEFILVASTVPAGNENTICYLDITPQYEGSKIHVEFCFSYSVSGFGTDSIITEIRVGKNNNTTQTVIQEIFQEWTDAGGGGTRSGAGSTISASYQNNDSLGKFHRIQLRIDNNSNDSWGLDSAAFVSIKVVEFIETAGTSNPNILIGTGNISCGNISCNTITATNHTIDNLITTENVNVGGSMVTVGFPESGVIVPSSMVRMAGGSVVQNYADMAWDGSTFNISTRQASKNFKVSFGQVAYLEVDSTNVSVQSLKVNQTLEVLGSLIYSDLILNDSLLLNGTFLAFGATFRDDVVFERDVDIEQTLNVSNINVSGNIVCGGTIIGSNISTAALIPGTNITITNNVISAFVEGDADIAVASLHVDNDANIYGILNVSQTSNFGQSLNVDNQLFVGKAGEIDGNLVLYSTNVGDNFQIQNYSDSATGFIGTGNISRFNFSLGGNRTLTIKPTQVNISGDLIVSGNITGTLSFDNLSATNLSVVNMTVDLIQGDLNAENILCDTVTTTGHVETGKWWIGASDTVTASLYNKDITSATTHYALHQTNGGGTSLNGTAVYFKNNGTDVGEWTATGLGIGKTNPTSTLDVSGDSFFAGEVDIVGDLTTENISATTLTTTGYVETGKWHFGALNTVTAELYNKDITSSTTHYALRQTNGGSTSLNGAEIYFKNDGVIIAEINGTGLGVGKTTPTKKLDVLGDSLFTGNVNISGILDADDIVLDNISNINFSGVNMTATELVVPLLSNVSFITSTGMIEFTTNGSPTLDLDELSSKFYHDVNISGTLRADAMANINCVNASFTNISATNLTVATIGNFSSQNISATTLSTTGHIETGKWFIGASNSTTASLYNTDITSVTTHYALHQTDGGATSLNGTAVYFKNNGTDIGEWTSTGLGVGKTIPTKKLDVLGNSLFTGDMNVCGTIYSDNVSSTIVNTPLVTSNILDLDGTDRILFNINNIPHMELIVDELYLYVDCIAQTMDVQQKLDGLNMSMTNISTARLTSTNTSVTNLSATQISSNFVLAPTLLNVSYLWSDGTIDFRTNTLPTLAMNNASAKFFQDVNISGTLRADAIEGIDLLNICSTNISTTNLSATTTSSNHINCSTLTVLDTGGAGGLDVTGTSHFRSSFFSYGDAYLEANDNYFGDPAGTELRSRINFWGQKTAGEVAVRFGCDTDDIVRLKLERFGLYTQYNINISNVSTMDMDNTSTKFHQNVNISGTLTADNIAGVDFLNICSTNISTTNLSTNKITFYTTYGLYKDFTGATNVSLAQVKGDILSALGQTFSATTLNSSTLNSSTIKARNIYVQDFGASINFSASGVLNNNLTGCVTNLKECNISTLNASIVNGANLSTATMEFGSGLTFALNTLSADFTDVEQTIANEIATAVDTSLVNATTANIGFLNVDGNANISNLNASNISCINLSATELTSTTIKHSDDFCRFFMGSNVPFNSAQTSYTAAFNSVNLTSTKITKNAAHDRFTINEAGYYKITANMIYENTTYQNRVVYRAEISINGNIFNGYGDSFVYVRDNRYGDYGSAVVNTLVNLSVNDYVEIYVTLKKDQSTFGVEMSGTQVRFRSAVDFEYLGV